MYFLKETYSAASHPAIIETGLPDSSSETKCLSRAKREAALDELNGFLQSNNRSDQQMKMIRHDDKFVQLIFALVPLLKECFHKEARHPIRLEKCFLLER